MATEVEYHTRYTALCTEGGGDGGFPQRGHCEVHPAADAEEQHQAGGQGGQACLLNR